MCEHPLPVDHAVAAGAADRRAGDHAALALGVLERDVLGVDVAHEVGDRLQRLVGIFEPGQEGVPRVPVDGDVRRRDELDDPPSPAAVLV